MPSLPSFNFSNFVTTASQALTAFTASQPNSAPARQPSQPASSSPNHAKPAGARRLASQLHATMPSVKSLVAGANRAMEVSKSVAKTITDNLEQLATADKRDPRMEHLPAAVQATQQLIDALTPASDESAAAHIDAPKPTADGDQKPAQSGAALSMATAHLGELQKLFAPESHDPEAMDAAVGDAQRMEKELNALQLKKENGSLTMADAERPGTLQMQKVHATSAAMDLLQMTLKILQKASSNALQLLN